MTPAWAVLSCTKRTSAVGCSTATHKLSGPSTHAGEPVLGFLHPRGRPGQSSWLLAWAWSSPGCCVHLGNEPQNGRSLCRSAFQEVKIHHKEYNSSKVRAASSVGMAQDTGTGASVAAGKGLAGSWWVAAAGPNNGQHGHLHPRRLCAATRGSKRGLGLWDSTPTRCPGRGTAGTGNGPMFAGRGTGHSWHYWHVMRTCGGHIPMHICQKPHNCARS